MQSRVCAITLAMIWKLRPDSGLDQAQSPRLFANDWLDRWSRVHPLTPVIVYSPLVVFCLMHATAPSPFAWFGCLVAGYLIWCCTEYFGHRFLFHRVWPLPWGWGPSLQYLLHGVHHRYPDDPWRLVMPLIMSAPIMALAYASMVWIIGGWPVPLLFAGFLAGYLLYDCIHYWVHHVTPRSTFGRWLKSLHMRHHFQRSDRGFGVHAIWCDVLFGTAFSAASRSH